MALWDTGGIEWEEPKTDWTTTDRFNLTDYNRIRNNLMVLWYGVIALYSPVVITLADVKTSYSDFVYADEINTFEQTLEKLNDHIYTQEIGDTATFYDNGQFIQASELNRLESGSLAIYDLLERQFVTRKRIQFRLGYRNGVRT